MLIGSARINELGQPEGGMPGDQNSKEVCSEPWYLHDKGWVVIRAKSVLMRQKIAQDMRWACANPMVGYSFWNSCYTLYNEVKKYHYDCSKVNIPTETNCAKLVWICALYAGSKVKDFYTGDEVEKFRATGEFDILTDDKYCKSPDYLLEGDILVTRTQGHTAVVLSNGKMTEWTPFKTADCSFCNLRKGDNINTAKITTLAVNTPVELFGWSETGWGYVRYNGKMGYISPLYLKELDKATCLNNDTWLRDAPGRNDGKQLIVIPKNTVVHLTGKTAIVGKTIWHQVIYKQETGWASGLYIKPLKEEAWS